MKKNIICLLFLFIPFLFFSQSNEKLSEILDSSEITYGQICYLSASAQGLIDDNASYSQAIQILFDKGQIPELVYENEPIVLANLAYIYAKLWNVKGGLMFRLTKGSPRYAFKQLKADSLIEKNLDPTTILTGQKALSLYTAGAYFYENQQAEDIE